MDKKRPTCSKMVRLMNQWVQIQQKLVPDLLKIMDERYSILKTIGQFEPIGRRSLAEQLKKTERHIRSEIEFLVDQGLIDVTNKGMLLNETGKAIVKAYPNIMREATDLNLLEKKLQNLLSIEEVHIVPGDVDQVEDVIKLIGHKAATILMEKLNDDSIVSVTGGSTVASIAEYLKPLDQISPLFVPARGGLGRNYDYQASSICVNMAQRMKGDYRLLHIPDAVSQPLYETMINEPDVIEVTQLIEEADIVVHGVGEAIKMAERRHTSIETINKMKENNAKGEAFGYYFDHEGQTIYRVNSIGMTREQLINKKCIITVAGGSSKAEALLAFFRWGKSHVLVTDEGVAKSLLNLFENK